MNRIGALRRWFEFRAVAYQQMSAVAYRRVAADWFALSHAGDSLGRNVLVADMLAHQKEAAQCATIARACLIRSLELAD
jgi:hypothetical protein